MYSYYFDFSKLIYLKSPTRTRDIRIALSDNENLVSDNKENYMQKVKWHQTHFIKKQQSFVIFVESLSQKAKNLPLQAELYTYTKCSATRRLQSVYMFMSFIIGQQIYVNIWPKMNRVIFSMISIATLKTNKDRINDIQRNICLFDPLQCCFSLF